MRNFLRFLLEVGIAFTQVFKKKKPEPTPDPVIPTPIPEPIDLSQVIWLNHDVFTWKRTSTLRSVSTTHNKISLDYDCARVWPGDAKENLNANPWIFIKKDNRGYAATWEWMRYGQTQKFKRAVAGDHIKRDPFRDWTPIKGTEYGFMVSGLCRDHRRNVEERTNIVMFTWR